MSKKSLVPLALLVIALLSTFFVFGSSPITGQSGNTSAPPVSLLSEKVDSGAGIRFGVWTLPPTISGADVRFFSMFPFERYSIAFSEIGEKRKLEFSKKNVVWTSSDESVAKISPNGVLEAVGRGLATIRAQAADSWCFDGAACERPKDFAEIEVSVCTDDILAVEVDGAAYGFILPWETDEKGYLELRARTYPRRGPESINDVEMLTTLEGARRERVFFTGDKELEEHDRPHTLFKPNGDKKILTVFLSRGDIMKPEETKFSQLGTLVFTSGENAVLDVYEGYSDAREKLSPITIHVRPGDAFSFPPKKTFPNGEKNIMDLMLNKKNSLMKLSRESQPEFHERFAETTSADGRKTYVVAEGGPKIHADGEAWLLHEGNYSQSAIVILHP